MVKDIGHNVFHISMNWKGFISWVSIPNMKYTQYMLCFKHSGQIECKSFPHRQTESQINQKLDAHEFKSGDMDMSKISRCWLMQGAATIVITCVLCSSALLWSSVVRRLSSGVNFSIFDYSSDLNVLYQVCVFRVDRKKKPKMAALWLAEKFSTSTLKPLNGIQQNLNVPYQVFAYRADQKKNKMAALASDWLRHFRLLL